MGHRFEITAAATLRDATGSVEPATLVNASASGLMLHLPVRPSANVGSHVEVEFLNTRLCGVIRCVSPSSNYGVFIDIELDPEDREHQRTAAG